MLINKQNIYVAILTLVYSLSACAQDVNSSLIRAAKKGDLGRVDSLIAKGADINFVGKDGQYALSEAASENQTLVVRALLKKGAKIHQVPGKMTPPEIAASNEFLDVLTVFLDAGYGVNTRQLYGYTLLHIAAQDGASKTIEMLIRKGANINARDDNGATPLFHAAGTNYIDCVKVLLEAGADPNIQTTDGNCPMTVAIGDKHLEIAAILKNKGAKTCR